LDGGCGFLFQHRLGATPMSKLWAFTCIILALGLGLIAGILVVMFVFILPRTNDEESEFLKGLKMDAILQAASPAGTRWDMIDSGSQFRGYSYRGTKGRRYMAECKMPNPTDQATFPNLLQGEFVKAMGPHGGMIYSMGGISSGGSAPATPGPDGKPVTVSSRRQQNTMPYAAGEHVGCVHVTMIGEGDRLIVTIIIHEDRGR
jgi:hypothetical protein